MVGTSNQSVPEMAIEWNQWNLKKPPKTRPHAAMSQQMSTDSYFAPLRKQNQLSFL